MKELVEYVAKSLVDDPDAVQIDERSGRTTTTYILHVAQGDAGRVIGKAGRVANAIRTLLRATSVQDNRRYQLEID
ncbi:MAG: KH domain-containing protein [Anaerolineae bacterium]|nr:KH domain-containing protein [Anaerolineae bacterium]